MSFCFIYKIINTFNNKVYVGQTWTTLNHRFGQHPNKKCCKLFNIMKKYGKDKFSIKLLTITHCQETADYWEIFFIKKYNSIKNGYNIREGGSCGKVSEETKRKISAANIGKNKNHTAWNKGIIGSIPAPHYKGLKTEPFHPGIKGQVPWNTGTIGRIIPWNKGKCGKRLLNNAQILSIISDIRSSRILAKEYNVSRATILNIRKRGK